MQAAGSRLTYQPGLDGLRAFAVAAVLAYHDGRLAGGFLGVSAFFTLSGFLITALLLAEHRASGRVSLRSFFARRVRRLLPAALAGLLLATAVTVVTTDGRGAPGFAGDGLAALANVANWRFVLEERSYADAFAAPSALTHLWSLSVEEQFYLVLAPLVAGVLWLARGRRALLAVVLAALATASVVAGVALTAGAAPIDRAYFGTDARAVELLIGALAAVVLVAPATAPHSRRVHVGTALAGAAAFAALVVLAVRARDADPGLFRGVLVLHAVLMAVVVVSAHHRGPVRALCSLRPLRWLGRVSYGVYLYHWPVFLLLDPARTGLDGIALSVVRVAVTLGLAALSYHLLEQPIRHGRWFGAPTRVRRLVAPAAIVAVALVVGAAGRTTPRPEIVFAAATRPPAPARAPAVSVPDPTDSTDATDAPDLRRMLILGDSVALTLGRGLERWGAAHGVAVTNAGALGCGLLDGAHVRGYWGVDLRPAGACEPVRTAPELVASVQPDVVAVLVGAWDVYDVSFDGGATWYRPGDPVFTARYAHAIEALSSSLSRTGARVVWLAPPCFAPPPGDPHPDAPWWDPSRVESLVATMEAVATRTGMVLSHTLHDAGCPVDLDARPDGVHFGDPGADSVAASLAAELVALSSR